MQIQINTDNTVENSDRLQTFFSGELETALSRFSDTIISIVVHMGDENGEKFDANDKRCLIEARIAGINPLTVTNHSDTLEKAFQGATDKMKTLLSKTLDKQRSH